MDNDLCEPCYRLFEQGRVKHPLPKARGSSLATAHVFRPFEGVARDGCLHWLGVPWVESTPPVVPDHFVVRPEFCSGIDSYFGSYALSSLPRTADSHS
jgi:hypothetical protein